MAGGGASLPGDGARTGGSAPLRAAALARGTTARAASRGGSGDLQGAFQRPPGALWHRLGIRVGARTGQSSVSPPPILPTAGAPPISANGSLASDPFTRTDEPGSTTRGHTS